MERTRRHVLTGAGAALALGLAGCSGDGGDGDADEPTEEETTDEPTETTEESTPTPTETPAQQAFVDEEVHLEVGHHSAYRVYHDNRFRLTYEFEVTSGEAIDVFVLSHSQLSRYESGRIFETEAQSLDTKSGSGDLELSSGTYHVVVDHSSAGEASPQSGIDQQPVDVQIRATSEPLS